MGPTGPVTRVKTPPITGEDIMVLSEVLWMYLNLKEAVSEENRHLL